MSHGCKTTGDRERIWIYGYIGIQDNIESPVYDCWLYVYYSLVYFLCFSYVCAIVCNVLVSCILCVMM